MLALTGYCALRRSLVTTLSMEDFYFAHRIIRIRAENTKSRRERIVGYSPVIAPMLAAILIHIKPQEMVALSHRP
nr:site-specific integrase [Pantoea dispersa]